MTFQERLDSDLKEAMRAKDATTLGVLRMLKSALKYTAIEKSGAEAELSDAEAARIPSRVSRKAGAQNWWRKKKRNCRS